jgi:hypothetical protein
MDIHRLKFLFKMFRVFNLFWIIFCALMVEMTLNKNNMLQMLAQHSQIQYPAQLLPLLIGGLSFIRVLWLIYAEGRDRVKEQKTSNQERFNRHETMTKPSLRNGYGLGREFWKILSPAKRPSDAPIFEVEPVLSAMLRPWHHRYLVALLPWLSTFDSWRLSERNDGSVDVEREARGEVREAFLSDRKVEAENEVS